MGAEAEDDPAGDAKPEASLIEVMLPLIAALYALTLYALHSAAGRIRTTSLARRARPRPYEPMKLARETVVPLWRPRAGGTVQAVVCVPLVACVEKQQISVSVTTLCIYTHECRQKK